MEVSLSVMLMHRIMTTAPKGKAMHDLHPSTNLKETVAKETVAKEAEVDEGNCSATTETVAKETATKETTKETVKL